MGINIYLGVNLQDDIEYVNTQTYNLKKILPVSIQVCPITFYFHLPWREKSTWPISAHKLNAQNSLCIYKYLPYSIWAAHFFSLKEYIFILSVVIWCFSSEMCLA